MWLPVVGYEGSYEVSSGGLVRSVRSGLIRKTQTHRDGHLQLGLCAHGVKTMCFVHTLVLEAHVGPRPSPAHQGCHRDGDPTNNRVSNLRWDTASANAFDAVRHGRHPQARRTVCPLGHELSPENTRVRPNGWRECLRCRREHDRARWHRRSAKNPASP
ncbi:NUMOD4 motif-containing HNH endonuclease [Marisediminicola sp. LYQ134]|uniref:NUMOD4 motif-containing HNH endonuclease n=1 Tax=Marisediminicola sp. LYQ134 TaxID=3391061 RepID=UPI00398316AB